MGRMAPTRNGHDFFVVSSLLQKSLRRGDVVLAARSCIELLPKYSNYVWKRLLVVSAEDCHGVITGEIVALHQAWETTQRANKNSAKPGAREGRIFFAKAIVLLAKAKHSRDQDELMHLCVNRLPDDVFEAALREVAQAFNEHEGQEFPIPEYVFDKHTAQGRRNGATLEDFLRVEHDDLDNAAPSMFANFDEMLEAWGYVEPQLRFGDDG